MQLTLRELTVVTNDLKLWYKRTRSKYRLQGRLTAERVRASGDWPKLKAKAAATRYLAAYALDLALRFARVESLNEFTRNHDQRSIAVCQLLVEFYDIIARESQYLSDNAKLRLPILGNQLAAIYSQLASMCFNRSLRLWRVTPKLHLFLHLVIHQAPLLGNPTLLVGIRRRRFSRPYDWDRRRGAPNHISCQCIGQVVMVYLRPSHL